MKDIRIGLGSMLGRQALDVPVVPVERTRAFPAELSRLG